MQIAIKELAVAVVKQAFHDLRNRSIRTAAMRLSIQKIWSFGQVFYADTLIPMHCGKKQELSHPNKERKFLDCVIFLPFYKEGSPDHMIHFRDTRAD